MEFLQGITTQQWGFALVIAAGAVWYYWDDVKALLGRLKPTDKPEEQVVDEKALFRLKLGHQVHSLYELENTLKQLQYRIDICKEVLAENGRGGNDAEA